MAQTGRPSKLTPEQENTIISGIRLGLYMEEACLLADVSSATMRRWLTKGKQAKRGPYHRFRALVKRAVAEASARDLQTIDAFAVGVPVTKKTTRTYRDKNGQAITEVVEETRVERSWQAAAWKRQHRSPKWAGQKKLTLQNPDGTPLRTKDGPVIIIPSNGRGDDGEARTSEDPVLAEALAERIKKNGGSHPGGNGDGKATPEDN